MSPIGSRRPSPCSVAVRARRQLRLAAAVAILATFVGACGQPDQPSRQAASPGSPASATATTPGPSPSTDAFRVNAGEGAAISTVERFVEAINARNFDAATALVAEDAGVSDCDFVHRTVIEFNGKRSVMQWLAARIADHDRLAIGSIYNENDVFTPVVGVEFANRTSDTLASLGSPNGIVPSEVAKVVLTANMAQISGFLLGPGGADPGTIADVCRPV